MEISNASKNVLIITIHKGHHPFNELTELNKIVAKKGDYDVIVDFSGIEIVTSLIIGKLIELRNLVHGHGHRLILSNVHFLSKCVFSVVGLRSVFEFADDKYSALEVLEHADKEVCQQEGS